MVETYACPQIVNLVTLWSEVREGENLDAKETLDELLAFLEIELLPAACDN